MCLDPTRLENIAHSEGCRTFTKVKSIIDAWHLFKSSYDETSNFLIISSYELLNICQASIVDESWYAKIILKSLGENDKKK